MLHLNNIRFGVKAPRKEEEEAAPSMLFQESKIKRRELKGKRKIGKGKLGRTILGEKTLEQERLRLRHIDTRLNNFHFIIH